MPDHLYRFRSINALLDDYHELESQQIYFCPPDELNDPMEAYKDIFWKGDCIVWKNFLRHYLLNLLEATSTTAVLGDDFTPNTCITFVHQTPDDLPQAPIREIYANACQAFFKHPAPERLISELSLRSNNVRRDELLFYLQLIHPLAIRCIFSELSKSGLTIVQSLESLEKSVEDLSKRLDELLQASSKTQESLEFFFSSVAKVQSQMELINEFNGVYSDDRRCWLFVIRDFPGFYVKSVERLIYPDWHVACFVDDPNNASMWGTYGDGHKGACLKFRTEPDANNNPTLALYRARSWSSGKDGMVPNYEYVPHPFNEVSYEPEFPEIDFFESIATLPRSKLTGFWFLGNNGEHSTTASRMLQEDEAWRQEYWRKFTASFSTKLDDWAHEKEYRLILYSNLQRFDNPESRKLSYRFADLTGIIFGMNMSNVNKIRAIRIIERKCAEEGRRDFEYYQAHYSTQTKKIELVRLSLLSSKSP